MDQLTSPSGHGGDTGLGLGDATGEDNTGEDNRLN